jgi:hypothetical protein
MHASWYLLPTLDLHNLPLTRLIHDQRTQLAPTHTPAVQPKRKLAHIQPALAVMSVDDARALALVQLRLAVIPELLPGRAAVVLGAGDARLEVDGAHVHGMERVLLLERDVRHQAGVHGDQGAHVRDVADAQDHGALLQEGDFVLGEGFGEAPELVVAVRVRRFFERVRRAVCRLVGPGQRREVRRFRLGDAEEQLVFPVAADARGAEFGGEFNYTGGIGPLGDHVAGEHEVVVFVAEVYFCEEALEVFAAAVHVADENEAVALGGEVLGVHGLHFDQALEFGRDVTAVAHGGRRVHVGEFLQVRGASWAKVGDPAQQEDEGEAQRYDDTAPDSPRDPAGRLRDQRLQLGRHKRVLFLVVEVSLLVRYVQVVAVAGDEVDERPLRVGIVAVRHGCCDCKGGVVVVGDAMGDKAAQNAWVLL